MNNNVKIDDTKLNVDTLNKLAKNANEVQESLRTYIVIENKINIWIRIANNAFLPLRNIAVLVLSSIYFYKKVILEDILSKIIDFAFKETANHWALLIICITAICFYFIKSRYK